MTGWRMNGWQEIAFFALMGLVFGSFLNVTRVRMPAGESIVYPGSHCVRCGAMLRWWQNIPVVSWLLLRGRCHACGVGISAIYPLMEVATAALWAGCAAVAGGEVAQAVAMAVFCWMMLLLAALDGEQLWLPDRVTWPAIGLGLLWQGMSAWMQPHEPSFLRMEVLAGLGLHGSGRWQVWAGAVLMAAMAAIAGAGMVLVIRLAYWAVRRREGMGLGDAKLMATLGAWLGWTAMMDAFFVAVLAATLAALVWLAVMRWKKSGEEWKTMPLPLGTFLALAAMGEIFRPAWLWVAWMRVGARF